ncbi:hypothetical protein Tco_1105459 [Tanacetum coccineum]
MSEYEKALFDPNGGRCSGNGGRGGSMTRRGGGWLAKRSIESNDDCGGLAVHGGRSSSESKNRLGDVGGVENMNSTRSKFIATGVFCLEGCDGVGGGEVDGGGVLLAEPIGSRWTERSVGRVEKQVEDSSSVGILKLLQVNIAGSRLILLVKT